MGWSEVAGVIGWFEVGSGGATDEPLFTRRDPPTHPPTFAQSASLALPNWGV